MITGNWQLKCRLSFYVVGTKLLPSSLTTPHAGWTKLVVGPECLDPPCNDKSQVVLRSTVRLISGSGRTGFEPTVENVCFSCNKTVTLFTQGFSPDYSEQPFCLGLFYFCCHTFGLYEVTIIPTDSYCFVFVILI